jgi:hypothetical protein
MSSSLRALLLLHSPVLVLAAPWLTQAQAPADPPPAEQSTDALIATKLFLEGRALLNQNKPQEACPLLERSHQIAPSLATLLNLALCHEYNGRLATAHEYYRRAETMATLAGDPKRQEFAHDAAAALAARRASLVLQFSGKTQLKGEVKIDDVPQPQEVWSEPMFLDAGEHQVAVRATGYGPWRGSVVLQDGGKHVLVIPELQPRKAALPPSAAPPQPGRAVAKAPADPGPNTARIVAYSVGGAGIAALGVSAIFAVMARSKYDDSKPDCRSNDICNGRGVRLRDAALADASVSTVLAIAGGTVLVGGLVTWLLAAPGTRTESRQLSILAGRDVIGAQWRTAL